MLKSRFYKICVIFLIILLLWLFVLRASTMHTLDMLRYYNIYNDYVYNN